MIKGLQILDDQLDLGPITDYLKDKKIEFDATAQNYPSNNQNLIHLHAKNNGYELKELSKKQAKAQASAGQENINAYGTIHGGWMQTMLDNVMANAAQTMIEPSELKDKVAFTTDFAQSIFKHLSPGDKVELEAKVIKAERKNRKLYILSVMKKAGELVSAAIGKFRIGDKEVLGLA